MANFEKILVPVDFSAYSAEAVRLAADLAQQYHGSITLVHVYDPLPYALPPEYDMFTSEQEARLTREFEKRLAVAKGAAESAGAQRVEARLLHGLPSAAILDAARSGQFDLIVMGTRGRTGIKHALLGSVAERVLRNAPCPVLTAKATE